MRVGDAMHAAKGGSMSSVYTSAQGLVLEILVVIIEPVLSAPVSHFTRHNSHLSPYRPCVLLCLLHLAH